MAGKKLKLNIACFKTGDSDWKRVYRPYIEGANALLKPHNMELGIPSGDPIGIPYQGPVWPDAGDPGTLRAQAHNALSQGVGIPLIFCILGDPTVFGMTIKTEDAAANNGIGWLPYILISTSMRNRAGDTIVHEMVHTTFPHRGDIHDSDPHSIFSENGNISDNVSGPEVEKRLSKIYAERLRHAYFKSA
ncbi:hypothetical protein [Methylobacterium dankookense]|uniref:Uncharacterized protein n=1 Tax=Methylobacterium dankookense TaxID=560405 RepID=A0A564G187_9HYPH|nr:hypothetical protein [Methylobacterium dankookense]GJD58833.1 hypothetical protein IFDJLNFL_4759 [Methylobacterium dankookense]VUF14195.1 hypothetical protein MTDSW087_03911 [Methylobacterium dankookense]